MSNNQIELPIFDNQEKGRFVTVKYVAKLFNVSPKTVRGWIYYDMIPSVKIGGARRFDLAEIEKWLSEKE